MNNMDYDLCHMSLKNEKLVIFFCRIHRLAMELAGNGRLATLFCRHVCSGAQRRTPPAPRLWQRV